MSRTVGDSLRLFLTALVLYKVIQLNLPVCVVVVGVATIIYTFVGGLKSVVWNDCIQFVIYIAGAIWALTTMVGSVSGGWGGLWEFARQTNRLDIVEWNIQATGYNIWVGVIGPRRLLGHCVARHGPLDCATPVRSEVASRCA